jgi:hypothetical protein
MLQTWHGSDSNRLWSSLNLVPPIRDWTPTPWWCFNKTFASAVTWTASSLVGQRTRAYTGDTRCFVLVFITFKTDSIAGSCLSTHCFNKLLEGQGNWKELHVRVTSWKWTLPEKLHFCRFQFWPWQEHLYLRVYSDEWPMSWLSHGFMIICSDSSRTAKMIPLE